MIKFKKGQIIPRWTGVITLDRKAQYHLKFGCDVEFENGCMYPITDGSVFMLPYNIYRRMSNGTKKKVIVSVRNTCVDGSRYKGNSIMLTRGNV